VNKDEASKTNNNKKLFDEQSCWITIHLGINPVKGGRPPNDKRFMNITNLIEDLDGTCLNKWLKWNVWLKWNNITTEKDIAEYTKKYNNHVLSLISKADIIQAIWLIDE